MGLAFLRLLRTGDHAARPGTRLPARKHPLTDFLFCFFVLPFLIHYLSAVPE